MWRRVQNYMNLTACCIYRNECKWFDLFLFFLKKLKLKSSKWLRKLIVDANFVIFGMNWIQLFGCSIWSHWHEQVSCCPFLVIARFLYPFLFWYIYFRKNRAFFAALMSLSMAQCTQMSEKAFDSSENVRSFCSITSVHRCQFYNPIISINIYIKKCTSQGLQSPTTIKLTPSLLWT